MSRISIGKTHHLTHRKARSVAERLARDLGQRFDLVSEWEGDRVHFERPGLSGSMHVGKSRITLDVTLGEGGEGEPDHLLAAVAHLAESLDEVVARLELRCQLRQLRDRDGLVSDALEMDRGVQDREHESQVDSHRRLERERLLHELLDAVVADVDLVVERDHLVAELGVLRLECGDGAADGTEAEVPLLLERSLERVETLSELDPHPNLPVT